MKIEDRLTKAYTLIQILDELFVEFDNDIEKGMKLQTGSRPNLEEIKFKLKSTLRVLKPFNGINLYEVDEGNTLEISKAYEYMIDHLCSQSLEQDIELANEIYNN